jgi:hypothetical protein
MRFYANVNRRWTIAVESARETLAGRSTSATDVQQVEAIN